MHSQSAKARWKISISIRGKWKSKFSWLRLLSRVGMAEPARNRLKAQSDKLAGQSKSTQGEKK
jgi:hypothetical protein